MSITWVQSNVSETITIEDAHRAGCAFWQRYPTAMLKARTINHLCRAIYPDLLGGFYDPLEPCACAASTASNTSTILASL